MEIVHVFQKEEEKKKEKIFSNSYKLQNPISFTLEVYMAQNKAHAPLFVKGFPTIVRM